MSIRFGKKFQLFHPNVGFFTFYKNNLTIAKFANMDYSTCGHVRPTLTFLEMRSSIS